MEEGETLKAISIDPFSKKIFWADQISIKKLEFDGSNKTTLSETANGKREY